MFAHNLKTNLVLKNNLIFNYILNEMFIANTYVNSRIYYFELHA